ncbi:PREDICTED: protein FAM167A-like [Priapulus caudatus]|uniref:Protein FAM167A-like n=1 Tax=Priapulus caudatus TaxID=37621 RepID=A0ABM1E849_PRICU|nr:PREDICTED: protein FAM167A-like [Priapulus caudatus]
MVTRLNLDVKGALAANFRVCGAAHRHPLSFDGVTSDGKIHMDQILSTLRHELIEMRMQDQTIARQLIDIRQEIQRLRLQKTAAEYEDMLADVTLDMAEVNETKDDLCDLPVRMRHRRTPLSQIGITRMNIDSRRFSMC